MQFLQYGLVTIWPGYNMALLQYGPATIWPCYNMALLQYGLLPIIQQYLKLPACQPTDYITVHSVMPIAVHDNYTSQCTTCTQWRVYSAVYSAEWWGEGEPAASSLFPECRMLPQARLTYLA